MRQLYTGARVFTADPDHLWAEALVVDAGRVVHVGDEGSAAAAAGPDAEVLEFAGGAILPGFVDAHAHLVMTGDCLLKAQLRTAPDLDEILRRLDQWRTANLEAPRVLGVSWQFSALPDGPRKEPLDALFPDVPVYLEANDLHSSWVNSAALAELGITADTPDPIGGCIVRDPVTGEATGHLVENAAVTMVWPLLAKVDDATRDDRLRAALRAYAESGVTSAVDMALDRLAFASMQRLDAAGELTTRIVGHWLIGRTGDPATELAQVERVARIAESYRSPFLRIAGIKIIVDGTIDGCTAALTEPYTNGIDADPIWDRASLFPVVAAADAAGLQVAMHAIGDAAVRSALDALEAAAIANGPRDRRHRIEHLEYVDEADVPRLAALGITASMQPVHIDPAIFDNWAEVLGPHRAHRGFAWPEYRDSGATLAFGTDTPTAPHLPLHNMYIAATRRSPGDPTLLPHRPDFALPLVEAVTHGTRDAAWASFAEHEVGTLCPGAAADLIVLDLDPFTGPPERLLEATVLRTVVGGRTVHPTPT